MLPLNNPLTFENLSKTEKYAELHLRWKGISEGENDLIANLANASGLLKQIFNWWWVGFYITKKNELVLGPFQGPVACTRIAYGKGVCGTALATKQTQLVPNVDAFPGHIACSAESKSEIVVPILLHNEVVAVLDADSEHLHYFDDIDKIELEKLAAQLAAVWLQ